MAKSEQKLKSIPTPNLAGPNGRDQSRQAPLHTTLQHVRRVMTPDARRRERPIAQPRRERQATRAIERQHALMARDALLDLLSNAITQPVWQKLREAWHRDVQPLAQHLAREGDRGEHAHAAGALDHDAPVDLRGVPATKQFPKIALATPPPPPAP